MQTAIGPMALDESQYFDITDYELELEVENHEQGNKISSNFRGKSDFLPKAPFKIGPICQKHEK